MFLYKTKEKFNVFYSIEENVITLYERDLFIIEDTPRFLYSHEVPEKVRDFVYDGVYFMQVIAADDLLTCYIPCAANCLTEKLLNTSGEVIARF